MRCEFNVKNTDIMEWIFFGIVLFLFLLAIFDLSVGVSNDAVNFLTSAVGSKAGSFRRVMFVAGAGVFAGACMSNGMMDIARHGIFNPENLSFYDVMAIFMAVMVTDVVLLDIFNSLGMPTSTTVSLVFELLGATFVVALFKVSDPGSAHSLGAYLNTEKALSVILGIFLSVAIAFVFGTVVQFLSRLIFTFEYKSRLKWKAALFGGVACTAIVYFMVIKGLKDMSFMTAEWKAWVGGHTLLIIGGCMAVFTLVSEVMYLLRVNVFKFVVMLGTFSLAMAFAGNDLVNFIGVPLTSLSSWQDYAAHGGGDAHGFMMTSLKGSADTPFYYLLGAGMIMVVSLAMSRKARKVTQTTVGLSSQAEGDEMFGTSRIGRSLVRASLNAFNRVDEKMPEGVKRWISGRMRNPNAEAEEGAAFDLVRGAVNLMLASVLIALGTSMKLPLSTTFVTFMVAMGTSLADKAWSRESAVFRVTGVISVIGGWFITAGVAFIGAGLVLCLMHLGGVPVMIVGGVTAVGVLVAGNIRYRRKRKETGADTMFRTILSLEDRGEVWPLLKIYISEKQKVFLNYASETYRDIVDGFLGDNGRMLGRAARAIDREKAILKGQRRKLTLCLRQASPETAMEKGTWFHLSNNMEMSMNYSLQRINEVCKEHVDNNFRPLPERFHENLRSMGARIGKVIDATGDAIADCRPEVIDDLRSECDLIKVGLSGLARELYEFIRTGEAGTMTVAYVYLNILQESGEFVTSLRKLLRAAGKLSLSSGSYRSFSRGVAQGMNSPMP